MSNALINNAVIPAQAELRRQDAEANAEGGPKGRPQERPVIQFLAFEAELDPGLRRDDENGMRREDAGVSHAVN